MGVYHLKGLLVFALVLCAQRAWRFWVRRTSHQRIRRPAS